MQPTMTMDINNWQSPLVRLIILNMVIAVAMCSQQSRMESLQNSSGPPDIMPLCEMCSGTGLPTGWKTADSPDGTPYYWKTESQDESQWERPSGSCKACDGSERRAPSSIRLRSLERRAESLERRAEVRRLNTNAGQNLPIIGVSGMLAVSPSGASGASSPRESEAEEKAAELRDRINSPRSGSPSGASSGARSPSTLSFSGIRVGEDREEMSATVYMHKSVKSKLALNKRSQLTRWAVDGATKPKSTIGKIAGGFFGGLFSIIASPFVALSALVGSCKNDVPKYTKQETITFYWNEDELWCTLPQFHGKNVAKKWHVLKSKVTLIKGDFSNKQLVISFSETDTDDFIDEVVTDRVISIDRTKFPNWGGANGPNGCYTNLKETLVWIRDRQGDREYLDKSVIQNLQCNGLDALQYTPLLGLGALLPSSSLAQDFKVVNRGGIGYRARPEMLSDRSNKTGRVAKYGDIVRALFIFDNGTWIQTGENEWLPAFVRGYGERPCRRCKGKRQRFICDACYRNDGKSKKCDGNVLERVRPSQRPQPQARSTRSRRT